ncbi:hypothetical protein UNDKW_2325 [Undibacterium sp. KW1]|uniref:hypothetical protein n=1 Tax=Undibacterium sp. KW1 TaxID=2058624 RepID=UPI001331CD52|nr:hypothetical protein [Undibacterium sp. KW1]BBB60598.1 hypothetical protein UNDKW_2325 [Undibacterium sp. KW1]
MKDPMNTPQDASNADALLDQQFSLLRKDLQELDTPAAIEQTLLQAFAKQQAKEKKQARRRRLRPWLAGLLTLSGSFGLVMLTVLFPASQHPLTPDSTTVSGTELPPFVALVPLERLNNETPSLLEAEVPAAWLASLGMPVSPEIAGDMVQAQMLVAADGEPLAMRLLK